MLNILIIEDDQKLSQHIKEILSPLGKTTQIYRGEEALFEAESGQYDFAVLDLMLPEMSGLEILAHLRKSQSTLPVLILTAKDSLEDKIHGFEIGADDYLTKPFHREELLMRSKAILKRALNLNEDQTLVFQDLTCWLQKHEVTFKEQRLAIQGKEFELLVYFLQNKDIILTKEQIFNRIWGFDSNTAITVVEVYMSHLRKHLKEIDYQQNLMTIRNVGYMFQTEVSQ